ncbi:MAG: TetR/AcrR family transcriptional regulator [Polyangiales bacterium]
MTAAQGSSTDGRVLRGARSHHRIVQALYELVREGHVAPTADEVAERAGVGTRTVFRKFDDLEALYRSLGDRLEVEVTELAAHTPPTGQLVEDLRTLVARRRRIFEHLAPFRRAGRIVRHTSPVLRAQDAVLARALRAGLVAVVGPHLSPLSTDRLEALDVLLSFEAWDRLRDEQHLSAKRAEQVIFEASMSLIRSTTRVSARVAAAK